MARSGHYVREKERGGRTYAYGRILRGCDERLSISAELAVEHRLSVTREGTQELPRGHLQHLGESNQK